MTAMKFSRGFTLVELALVLLALGLILPGAVIFWQFTERQRVEAVQMDVQKQSRDALLGFVHAQYRLPCPAVDALGVEDCSGNRQIGYMPWRTVGLPRPDAGVLRYGVYREPSASALASAPVDRDLAVARDRLNPTRALMPNPRPTNSNTSPHSGIPPIPRVSHLEASEAVVLGATYSGIPSAPLNTACDASRSPPCPMTLDGSVGLVDMCLALHTSGDPLVAPVGRLATLSYTPSGPAQRRVAAFVLVAPGLLDADGDGQAFDGANATVTDAAPSFEGPSRGIRDNYDDGVVAVSPTELFSELQCAPALAAVVHAHFNVATASSVMERGMYDYRDQLYIMTVLADADVAASVAGILSATAGTLDASKEMVSAMGDTVVSWGGRFAQTTYAAGGLVLAVAGVAAATATVVIAAQSHASADGDHSDYAATTTAITNLSREIHSNALKADAIGY